jgi:hypothetical protein
MHIIPLPAKEIEKRLKNIPNSWSEVAEQNFDPESIHAQSGIAVAEALENAVQLKEQDLDADQQAQVRDNIGAASTADIDSVGNRITNLNNQINNKFLETNTKLGEADANFAELFESITIITDEEIDEICGAPLKVGSVNVTLSADSTVTHDGNGNVVIS